MRLFPASLVRTWEMRHSDHGLTRFASTKLWPSGLGHLRIVRRSQSILLVTEGLSAPWDPALHAAPPRFTFDIELALEVPTDHLVSTTDAAIAKSWLPELLWALTDWVVTARVDIKAHLAAADVMTIGVPRVRGLERHVDLGRYRGVTIGWPSIGPGDVWLLTAKLLTADEYKCATRCA